jgi:putative inorganic carbon (hco3(-)) transporter
MGFLLTVAYVVLTIISPEQFGPEWANYHVLEYLAAMIVVASLPNFLDMLNYGNLRSSIPTLLMLGLIIAIALSEVANGWLGGVVTSWEVFLPNAAIYFFIVANVRSIRRLQILVLASVASCLVVVIEALCGYYGGYRGDMFVLQNGIYLNDEVVGQFVRIRGAGFLHDPNDLAQILLIALVLIVVAWQRGRVVANSLLVLAPAALLLWAIFLTHSRGALIALAVLALISARKKLGTTASAVLTFALVFGLLALGFSGGREISVAEGADRLEAWATGLELFKSAPLFGIGFGNFTDFNDITAHNSFVLCFAELGLVGSTIWVALLVTTMMGLNRILQLQEKWAPRLCGEFEHAEQAAAPQIAPSFCEAFTATAIPFTTDIGSKREPARENLVPKRWIVAIRLALIAFITTSWFLSRSYNAPMYLVLGLATATIAIQRPDARTHISTRWMLFTLGVEAAVVTFIYAVVRLRY